MFPGLGILNLGWAKIVIRWSIKKHEDFCHNGCFYNQVTKISFQQNEASHITKISVCAKINLLVMTFILIYDRQPHCVCTFGLTLVYY